MNQATTLRNDQRTARRLHSTTTNAYKLYASLTSASESTSSLPGDEFAKAAQTFSDEQLADEIRSRKLQLRKFSQRLTTLASTAGDVGVISASSNEALQEATRLGAEVQALQYEQVRRDNETPRTSLSRSH